MQEPPRNFSTDAEISSRKSVSTSHTVGVTGDSKYKNKQCSDILIELVLIQIFDQFDRKILLFMFISLVKSVFLAATPLLDTSFQVFIKEWYAVFLSTV